MLVDWSDIVVVMSWASGMYEGNAEIFVAQYSLDVDEEYTERQVIRIKRMSE